MEWLKSRWGFSGGERDLPLNRKGESGVALILVLTSLLILTTVVVEFAYNSHITYEVAASERDRLKAYYLARSALNFLKLELFVEKKLRSQFAGVLKDLQNTGLTSAPLCSQIPLSTDMLRSVSSGGNPFATKEDIKQAGEGESGEEKQGENKKEKKTKQEAPADTFEGLSHQEEGFLNFDGDFDANCESEEKKLNVNLFREEGALYDQQKNLLLSILSQPDFDDFFDSIEARKKLTNAIADWVDANDRINEAPGVEGSLEDSEYTDPEIHYKVKNGRFTSLQELMLVAGMTDDIFQKLQKMVTIYGDQHLNICEAAEPTVRAFITRYAQSGAAAPIDPKDEVRWKVILTAVQKACNQANPQPAQIAAAITSSLGQVQDSTNPASTQNLVNQITTTDRFYTLEGTGEVENIRVRMRAVVDTGNASPNLWKTLYFQAE